jgi:hypothetical protein
LKQYRYVFGELKGDIRICKCGEVTSEWDSHLCRLTEEEVTDDPTVHLTNIEDTKGAQDIGRMGYNILIGAMEEGADAGMGLSIVTAYFAGMFYAAAQANAEEKKEKDDSETPSS